MTVALAVQRFQPQEVCSHCGIVAVGQNCPICQKPSVGAAAGSSVQSGLYCAVLRAAAPCRVCGLAMPINHLLLLGLPRE